MDVGFYHCTRSSPETVVPQLAEKALAANYRLLVRVAGPEEAGRLDELLWNYRADSFLPHGVAGVGDEDARQPLLISTDFSPVNDATLAISMSQGLPFGEAKFDRVLLLFDGSDGEETRRARGHWRAVAEREDVSRTYWQQTERGWSKSA